MCLEGLITWSHPPNNQESLSITSFNYIEYVGPCRAELTTQRVSLTLALEMFMCMYMLGAQMLSAVFCLLAGLLIHQNNIHYVIMAVNKGLSSRWRRREGMQLLDGEM